MDQPGNNTGPMSRVLFFRGRKTTSGFDEITKPATVDQFKHGNLVAEEGLEPPTRGL